MMFLNLLDLVGEVTERLPMISIFKNLLTDAIDATGMISSDRSFERIQGVHYFCYIEDEEKTPACT